MGMGCGMSFIKYVLFIFNLLCALCGLVLLVLGVIFVLNVKDLDKLSDGNHVTIIPAILIVLGGIIFLISFFGCCGAIRESHCMTLTYSFFLIVLIIAQIVLAALVLTNNEDIGRNMQKQFESNIWANKDDPGNKNFIDLVQKGLECCGLDGPQDYVLKRDHLADLGGLITGGKIPNYNAPPSCCATVTMEHTCDYTTIYTSGCKQAVYKAIDNGGKIVGYVVLGIAAVELIGFIFACCLANSIRNQERRYA